MKFSIITPTYKRPELLKRAVDSLLLQTYKNWEMIIINDSPYDENYSLFTSSLNDPRIRYVVNDMNKGVNFSRNKALDILSADSAWVIFLDDDDYLAPDTLATFAEEIITHPHSRWFVSNRAYKNGTSVTKFPYDATTYSYAWSYLILKRCKGDATHCIQTKLITHSHIRFSKYTKQGEEWFFFYQLGILTKLYYRDHNSTITDGYDTAHGLNFRKRARQERFETVTKLLYEGAQRKILQHPTFLLYILIRYVRLLIG